MTGPRDDPRGWSRLWRASGAGDASLARVLERRVRRESRRMWWTTIAQSLVSLLVLGFVAREAMEQRDAFHLVWAAGVGVLVVAAWTFLLLNRRGVWAPYGESTHSFIALGVERCRRRLRMVRVLTALAALHLAFTAWVAWWGLRLRPGQPVHPADAATYIVAVVLLLAMILWAAWYRRRIRQELSQLDDLANHIA